MATFLGFVISVLAALFVLSFMEFLSVLTKIKESNKNGKGLEISKGNTQLERINLDFKSILKSLIR